MKRILLFLVLSLACIADVVRYIPAGSNVKNEYTDLALSPGVTFSAINRGVLVLAPGTYTQDIDMSYECIDIVESVPGTVIYTGTLTITATDAEVSWIGWDDLRIPITTTKLGGTKDPGFEVFRTNTGGTSQGVFVYQFDKTSEEEVYFIVQLPHSYKLGTNVLPHAHWAVDTVPAGGTNVRWGLEYTVAEIGNAFPVTTTVYTTATDPVTQYKHLINSFTAISGSNVDSISAIILCRVFRDVANDNFDDDAALLEVDFHYQIDRNGSRKELVK